MIMELTRSKGRGTRSKERRRYLLINWKNGQKSADTYWKTDKKAYLCIGESDVKVVELLKSRVL